MEKDADAYRTISEVAETLDIPPHVLRFWESKFPQIKPLKRGGGRRYYRRSDTDLLRAIRQLLYEDGYTIRGVQRLLRRRGVSAMALMDPSDRPSPQEAEAGPAGDDDRLAGGDTPREFGPALAQLRADIAACRSQLDEALDSMGRDGLAVP